MRLVADPAELAEAVSSRRERSRLAFGDGTVFLERFVTDPRHVEVQILGDTAGHRGPPVRARVLHPASLPEDRGGVPVTGRRRLSAGRADRRGRHRGPGDRLHRRGHRRVRAGPGRLVLLPGDEHPAAGRAPGHRGGHRPGPGGAAAADRRGRAAAAGGPRGARSTATPSRSACTPRMSRPGSCRPPARCTGSRSRQAPGIRVDTGFRDGSVVSPHYDAMLAKVIAHGRTRADAARRLARALLKAEIHGVTTNRDLLVAILREPGFLAGATDTGYLTRHDPAALAAPRSRRYSRAGRGAGPAGAAPRRGAGPGHAALRLAQRLLRAAARQPTPRPASPTPSPTA